MEASIYLFLQQLPYETLNQNNDFIRIRKQYAKKISCLKKSLKVGRKQASFDFRSLDLDFAKFNSYKEVIIYYCERNFSHAMEIKQSAVDASEKANSRRKLVLRKLSKAVRWTETLESLIKIFFEKANCDKDAEIEKEKDENINNYENDGERCSNNDVKDILLQECQALRHSYNGILFVEKQQYADSLKSLLTALETLEKIASTINTICSQQKTNSTQVFKTKDSQNKNILFKKTYYSIQNKCLLLTPYLSYCASALNLPNTLPESVLEFLKKSDGGSSNTQEHLSRFVFPASSTGESREVDNFKEFLKTCDKSEEAEKVKNLKNTYRVKNPKLCSFLSYMEEIKTLIFSTFDETFYSSPKPRRKSMLEKTLQILFNVFEGFDYIEREAQTETEKSVLDFLQFCRAEFLFIRFFVLAEDLRACYSDEYCLPKEKKTIFAYDIVVIYNKSIELWKDVINSLSINEQCLTKVNFYLSFSFFNKCLFVGEVYLNRKEMEKAEFVYSNGLDLLSEIKEQFSATLQKELPLINTKYFERAANHTYSKIAFIKSTNALGSGTESQDNPVQMNLGDNLFQRVMYHGIKMRNNQVVQDPPLYTVCRPKPAYFDIAHSLFKWPSLSKV